MTMMHSYKTKDKKQNKENPAKPYEKIIISPHFFISSNSKYLFQFSRVTSFAFHSFLYLLAFWESTLTLLPSIITFLLIDHIYTAFSPLKFHTSTNQPHTSRNPFGCFFLERQESPQAQAYYSQVNSLNPLSN